jgi:hypothetical protein
LIEPSKGLRVVKEVEVVEVEVEVVVVEDQEDHQQHCHFSPML